MAEDILGGDTKQYCQFLLSNAIVVIPFCVSSCSEFAISSRGMTHRLSNIDSRTPGLRNRARRIVAIERVRNMLRRRQTVDT